MEFQMLPVLSRAYSLIASPFVREVQTSDGLQKIIRLERVGYLYLIASVIQASWLVLILSNWQRAWIWARLPMVGWPSAIVWLGMLVCIPFLSYVGYRLVSIRNDPHTIIYQTPHDQRLMGLTAELLMLGILLDVILVPILLLCAKDVYTIFFFSMFMGVRVLAINMEAIFKYYGH